MSESFSFLDLAIGKLDHLPEKLRSSGKFVQLKHAEEGEFIIIAPLMLCSYHAQIIEAFCFQQEPNWAFEMNEKRDDGILHEPNVEIIGGGFYEIFSDKKRLNLTGVSQAYGAYNGYNLDLKIKTITRFVDYSIFC